MTVRNRSRLGPLTSGTRVTVKTGATAYASMFSLDEKTIDVVGLGDNQPFSSEKITKSGGLISGRTGSGSFGSIWSTWPADYFRIDPYAYSHLSMPLPNYSALAMELLQRTNPSRASMQAIVSAFEIREIPGLIQDGLDTRWRNMFRKIPRPVFNRMKSAAKLNLMVQFGILPLLGDLQTITDFPRLVDQRVMEIRRMEERGLRRTIDLWTGKVEHTIPNAFFQSNGTRIRGSLKKTTTVNIRGHARWRVPSNFQLSDQQLRLKALRIISGNYFDWQTLYEAMPWSWLIDYFTNLGQFVGTTRNALDAVHDTPRIMTERTTTIEGKAHTYSSPSLNMTDYECTVSTKSRSIVTAGLASNFEMLTANQMSILASLSMMRGR